MANGNAYRVIVTGGREYGERYDWRNRERPGWRDEVAHVRRVLDEIAATSGPVQVVHGGCGRPGRRKGADRRADEWARHRHALGLGPEPAVFEADWFKYGREAGPRRNRTMAAAGADEVVAFPGGRGTADCVRAAEEAGLPIRDERANGPTE